LEKEENNQDSCKDFGKDIIPAMLHDNLKLHAYQFKGYWKDVGTIDSFWEANMDLLEKESNIFLKDKEWNVYTVEQSHPPVYLDDSSAVKHSLISEACEIYGTVENSVIFQDVTIGKGAVIKDSVLLPGAVVGENAVVERAVVSSNVKIDAYSVIKSSKPYDPIALIGENVVNDKKLHELSRVI